MNAMTQARLLQKPGLPLLQLEGITKQFPGVLALDHVDLDFRCGEMHALAGENGAGKSTIIRILAGIYAPDSGRMLFDGAPYAPQTPRDAIDVGIRVVHQEFNLLPALSIGENILFEYLPRHRLGMVNRRRLREEAAALMARVGLQHLSPDMPVERLGVAEMQLVEIARALSTKGRILILDEPTATLTPREADVLFEQIDALKALGMTIIFVSHHLDEIFAHCDRVSVLRNGRHVITENTADTDAATLVRHMIGRQLAAQEPVAPMQPGREALRVEHLRPRGSANPEGVGFTLHYGEILGLGGLVGAGRTEILRAIFGADPIEGGEIFLDGKKIAIRSPRDAVKNGICLLTENRKEEGLILPMAARVNVTLARLNNVARGGILHREAERQASAEMAKSLAIRLSGPEQPVVQLSGGNQQKVVLAKWLFGGQARILMLDEPTRGIDVGAKAEIYALLGELARQGCAILVVSSEIPELMRLCDRIKVLSRGVIAGTLEREEFNEEAILSLAYSQFMTHAETSP
ncbi:sugar ABC transporter ATP-binding protein [Kozakia baliensis]|uniref:sugar ABC transporter ATP-binding protein n=1 Tax=Kozakia baliensis TaxID=153496 RepID=UPI000AC21131|nr:sugar ABC transporter ATP-binding protein [Kozakia baliensis]